MIWGYHYFWKHPYSTWKWMVGILDSFLGWPNFRCYVSFREGKWSREIIETSAEDTPNGGLVTEIAMNHQQHALHSDLGNIVDSKSDKLYANFTGNPEMTLRFIHVISDGLDKTTTTITTTTTTKWAATSYEWIYMPYQWPYTWVTGGEITPTKWSNFHPGYFPIYMVV